MMRATLSACMALAISTAPVSAAQLNGFDGYRFGMTKDEVENVDRRRSVDEKCDYKGSKRCLIYYTMFAGLITRVPVLISDETGGVQSIPLFIDNGDQPANLSCKDIWARAVEHMSDTYGMFDTRKTNELHWSFDTGMQIDMVLLYISEKTCPLMIVFKQR